MLALVGLWPAAEAARVESLEYKVKAAFLFHFTKFVAWPEAGPEDAPHAIEIGVLGEDPFGETLDLAVRGKTVGGRQLLVRRSRRLEDLATCRILFISASERERLPEILQWLGDRAILTVGESERFASHGGMIGLLLERNKVRFEINVEAANRAGLRISSKLLALARAIRGSKEHRR